MLDGGPTLNILSRLNINRDIYDRPQTNFTAAEATSRCLASTFSQSSSANGGCVTSSKLPLEAAFAGCGDARDHRVIPGCDANKQNIVGLDASVSQLLV